MAEIYQNPSLFSGSLAPPTSLIPEAPKPDNDNWALLLSLLNQGLPIMPIIQAALNGQISVADAVNRATYPGGYNNNQNVPFQVPNPFALDTTNAPPSIQNLLGGPSTPPPTTTTQPPTAPPAPPPNNAPTGNPNANNPAYNPRPQPLFSYNNPFYSSVTSPVLNEQGQEVGQTNLANNQFGTPGMVNSLLNYIGSTYGLNNGRVVESQYSGPTRPSQSELGIQFGNSPVINAGLEYQRLQNTNNYSRPYLDAQFQDTLKPGSSGWSNYANGGQSINSIQAEKLYAGNPNTDPNVNPMGQAWKSAQTNGAYSGPQSNINTNTNPNMPPPGNASMGGPSQLPAPNTLPSTDNNAWRSLPGNTTISGYAGAQNQRAAAYNNPMNFRGQGTMGSPTSAQRSINVNNHPRGI